VLPKKIGVSLSLSHGPPLSRESEGWGRWGGNTFGVQPTKEISLLKKKYEKNEKK